MVIVTQAATPFLNAALIRTGPSRRAAKTFCWAQ
jgi:hypothetical protein